MTSTADSHVRQHLPQPNPLLERIPDGAIQYPHHDEQAPDFALAGYLAQARLLLEGGPPWTASPQGTVSPTFDRLRWFELSAECLIPRP